MDHLRTPWRHGYVTTPGGSDECIFCAAAKGSDDRATLVVHRAAHNFVILNRYPYTSGHMMAVPYTHAATLEDLPDEALAELMLLARDGEKHLRAIYHPDGLNLGMNIGQSAGAGIAGHVHLHVLPRWAGDTNFMTAVSETRVLPEDLDVTWDKLSRAFAVR